jgi:hypothetical protein
MYHEPESEPISPQGGVARPWITWVKGMQSAAPLDFRSIIMGIFQRVFSMFFSGVGGGAGGSQGGLLSGLGGRQMTDRRARIQEFRKTLASEISGALQARNTGQLNHYLQERGLTTSPSSSTRSGEQESRPLHHLDPIAGPTRSLTTSSVLSSAAFLLRNGEHEGEKITSIPQTSQTGSPPKRRPSLLGRKKRSLSGDDSFQRWEKETKLDNHSNQFGTTKSEHPSREEVKPHILVRFNESKKQYSRITKPYHIKQ